MRKNDGIEHSRKDIRDDHNGLSRQERSILGNIGRREECHWGLGMSALQGIVTKCSMNASGERRRKVNLW